jgi:hypothetical protein
MLLAQPLDKAVDKEAQLCQQFALPTAWSGAVRKASARFWGKPSFANSLSQSCWQSWHDWWGKPSFANSLGQSCWQSWRDWWGKPSFANSFGPCCWQSWEFFPPFLLLFSSL